MLGIARHSQYAGWGQVALRPAFASTSTVSKVLTPTTAGSLLVNGTDRNWNVDHSGSIDISGLTSVSNYHDYKVFGSVTFYLPFPSGLSDNYYGTLLQFQSTYSGYSNPSNPSATQNYMSINIDIVNSGKLQITYGNDNNNPKIITTDSYTNYTNRWLTVVYGSTDDYNDFANYSGSTSTQVSGYDNIYDRVALYDSEDGELLAQADNTASAYWQGGRVSLSDFTATSIGTLNTSSEYMAFDGFAGGGQDHRLSSFFFTLGQTIDPAGISAGDLASTVWTSHPNPVAFTNGTALVKAGLVSYTTSGSPVDHHYITEDNAGKYSQANDRVIDIDCDATSWSTGYSTTIKPKDRT